MTENEALRKTCPNMTYCVNPDHVAQYNATPEYGQSSCQASGCMAWRWETSINQPEEGGLINGYCGLAGKP